MLLDDKQVLELPEVVALIEQAHEDSLPVVGAQIVEAWKMGYAYLWHKLSTVEKERINAQP